jgi:hypothetical protein
MSVHSTCDVDVREDCCVCTPSSLKVDLGFADAQAECVTGRYLQRAHDWDVSA